MVYVFRYLWQTLRGIYSPLDSRSCNQTQFMSLRYGANIIIITSTVVTGVTGVATLPREHQRIVSIMNSSSD